MVGRSSRTVRRWLDTLGIEIQPKVGVSFADAVKILELVSPPEFAEKARQTSKENSSMDTPSAVGRQFHKLFDVTGLEIENWLRRHFAHGHELHALIHRLVRTTAGAFRLPLAAIEALGKPDQPDDGVDAAIHAPRNQPLAVHETAGETVAASIGPYDPLGIFSERSILQMKATFPKKRELTAERKKSSVDSLLKEGYRYILIVGEILGRSARMKRNAELRASFGENSLLLDADSIGAWLSAHPLLARDLGISIPALVPLQGITETLRELRQEVPEYREELWGEQVDGIRRFAFGDTPSRLLVVYGRDHCGKTRAILETIWESYITAQGGQAALVRIDAANKPEDVIRALGNDRTGILIFDDGDAKWNHPIQRALGGTDAELRVILVNRNPEMDDADVKQVSNLNANPATLVFRENEVGTATANRRFATFLEKSKIASGESAYKIACITGGNITLAEYLARQWSSESRDADVISVLNLSESEIEVLAAISLFSSLPPNSERMLGIVQEKLRIDNRTWSRIVRRLGKRGFIVNDPYHLCVPGAVIAENMLRRALQSLVPGVRFPLDLNDAATVIFRVSDLFPAELQLRVFNRFIQTDNDAFATLRTALFDYLVGTPSDWREFGDQCYDWRFTMRRVLASNPERTCAVLQRLAQTVPQEDEYFEWSGFREACDVVEDFCWTDDADLFRRAENLLREFGTVTDATRNTWKSLWNAYAAPTLATWDVRFEILQRLVRAGNEPATRALADAHAEPRWFTYSVRTVRIGNAAHYSSPRGPQTRDELLARLKQLENLAIDAIVENTPAAIDAVLQMLYRWAHSETLARLVDVPLSEADRTKALRRLGALLDEEELERWHIPAEIADEMRRWSEILRGQSPVENFIASLPQLQNAFSAEETRQRHEQAQQLAAHTLPTTIKRAVQRLLDDGGWDEISLLGTIAAAADPDSELFAWYVQQLTRDGKLQTTQGHRNILRGVLHRANQAGNPMLVLSNLALPIANGLGPHATIDEYTLAIDIVSAFPDELNAWERLLPILRTASTSRGRKIVSSFRFSEMMRSSNAQQRAEFFTALNEWAQAATEPENQTDLDRIATQPQPLWVLARAERALHALDLAGTLVYHFEKNDADKIAWNVLDEPVPRAMIRKLALDACYRLRREGYFKLNELADRLDDADFRLESASRLLQGNLFDIEAVNQVLQPIAASHSREILDMMAPHLVPEDPMNNWRYRFRDLEVIGELDGNVMVDWVKTFVGDQRLLAAEALAEFLARPRPTSDAPMPSATITFMNEFGELPNVMQAFLTTVLWPHGIHRVPNAQEHLDRKSWWQTQINRTKYLDSPQREWQLTWATAGLERESAERQLDDLHDEDQIYELD